MTARTTVLLTGFGPFPGVPVNATMRLVPDLCEAAQRLLPDVRCFAELLQTEWASAPERAAHAVAEARPDLVLHFGVSRRARGFEIETRARNVCGISPDAAGVMPPAPVLMEGAADFLRVSLPVQHLVARLRARSIPAYASRDAGSYLCNAVLYHSLAAKARDQARSNPMRVGFIHIPESLARVSPGGWGRSPLSWPQALEGGLEIIAGCLGRMTRANT